MTDLNETNQTARDMLKELHGALGRDIEKVDTLYNIMADPEEQSETILHILLGISFSLDFIGNGFAERVVEVVGKDTFDKWAFEAMQAQFRARLEGIERVEDEDKRAAMLADLLREAVNSDLGPNGLN